MAQESGGLLVIDVSKPSAPKLLAADSLSNNPQDVALSGNYALLPGRYGSFSVVDVSDPANLHNFSTQVTGGRGISVNGSQAYLATSGAGIQTLDISNPTSPIATGGYRTPGYARKGVAQGDRLWIADAEAGLWSVPLTSMNQALAIQAGIAGGAMKLPATVRPSGHLQIPVLAPPMRNGMQAPRIATVAGSPCVVSTTLDSGVGSLRNCLAAAGSGDTITFDARVFPPTAPTMIRLQSPLPTITQGNLTIDASSAGVILSGSNLGADANGIVLLSNGNTVRGLDLDSFPGAAILVTGGTAQNVIGGDRSQGTGPSGQGNTIGNGAQGIVVSGTGTSGNIVKGNYLGTSTDGMRATGWANQPGVSNECVAIAAGANANQIGSTVPGERNLIGNCGWPTGLLITGQDTSDNLVIGNYIGINASGDNFLLCGSTYCGGGGQIMIGDRAARNLIGGTGSGQRNVISGAPNAGIGVNDLGTVDNVIAGNYIGTDATGTRSMANGNFAIWLDGMSSRTRIQNNVIATNQIGLWGDYNVVVGNLIGTDASGKVVLGNGGTYSMSVNTTRQNRIGGAAPGEGNVIASTSNAVWIEGFGTEKNYVIGNLIGTDASGAALPQGSGAASSGQVGIGIGDGSKRNVVGGSADAEANLIAGSAGDGIDIGYAGVSSNFVGRNWIGANREGVTGIANRGNGVKVSGADHTFIMGNHIASNGNAGVFNVGGAATTIRGNAIHGNGIGIVVSLPAAPSAPAVSAVTATSVAGTACGGCAVEVFSDTGSQGGYFEGAIRASSSGAFELDNPGGFRGPNLTATTTTSDSLTSMFSAPVPVAARLGVSIAASDNYTQPQTGRTYTVTVSDGASAGPTGGIVTVTATVSDGVTLVAMSGTGWTCVTNFCTSSGMLYPGSSFPPITITVNVASNAPSHGAVQVSVSGGGSLTATATDSALGGSMAHLAVAGGWDTTLTLLNLSSTQVQTHLDFFDNGGNPLALPVGYPQSPSASPVTASAIDSTLAGNSLVVLDSTGPAAQAVQTGSAQLFTSGNAGGFAIFTDTTSGQQATVPLEARNASWYRLAFDNTGSLATGVALANIAAASAAIPVTLQDDSGATLGTGTISLPAQGHTSFVLTDAYPATTGRRGTVQFGTPSGGQISVLGLRFNGGALTTIPVQASSTPGGGSLAHVVSGGSWQTTITLVNLGATPAEAHLEFYADSGAALPLEFACLPSGTVTTNSVLDVTIQAGATLTLATQGADAPAILSGSAQLTSGGLVSGFGIFRSDSTGQEAVVPLESRSPNAFVLAFDNTNGLVTGLALANLSVSAATVPAIFRDDTGAAIGSAAVSLPGEGHTSFVLTSLSAATAGQRGTVEFDVPTGGQISALGLRFTPAGVFTTMPAAAK